MSYILDALRKADAQRQRTRLPGLQAQPSAAPADGGGPAWRSPVPWLLAAGLLLVMGILAWPRAPSAPAVAIPEPVVPAPVAQAAPPVVAAAPEPVPQMKPQPPAATAIQPAPPPPRLVNEATPRVASRSTVDRPALPRAAPAPAPVVAAPTGPAPAPSAAPAAAESTTAPAGVPKLAITGGVYSTDAAQRLLIVGGQVFNEGSEVAPGVVLEQVRPGQAVLSYQGQRFTARY